MQAKKTRGIRVHKIRLLTFFFLWLCTSVKWEFGFRRYEIEMEAEGREEEGGRQLCSGAIKRTPDAGAGLKINYY